MVLKFLKLLFLLFFTVLTSHNEAEASDKSTEKHGQSSKQLYYFDPNSKKCALLPAELRNSYNVEIFTSKRNCIAKHPAKSLVAKKHRKKAVNSYQMIKKASHVSATRTSKVKGKRRYRKRKQKNSKMQKTGAKPPPAISQPGKVPTAKAPPPVEKRGKNRRRRKRPGNARNRGSLTEPAKNRNEVVEKSGTSKGQPVKQKRQGKRRKVGRKKIAAAAPLADKMLGDQSMVNNGTNGKRARKVNRGKKRYRKKVKPQLGKALVNQTMTTNGTMVNSTTSVPKKRRVMKNGKRTKNLDPYKSTLIYDPSSSDRKCFYLKIHKKTGAKKVVPTHESTCYTYKLDNKDNTTCLKVVTTTGQKNEFNKPDIVDPKFCGLNKTLVMYSKKTAEENNVKKVEDLSSKQGVSEKVRYVFNPKSGVCEQESMSTSSVSTGGGKKFRKKANDYSGVKGRTRARVKNPPHKGKAKKPARTFRRKMSAKSQQQSKVQQQQAARRRKTRPAMTKARKAQVRRKSGGGPVNKKRRRLVKKPRTRVKRMVKSDGPMKKQRNQPAKVKRRRVKVRKSNYKKQAQPTSQHKKRRRRYKKKPKTEQNAAANANANANMRMMSDSPASHNSWTTQSYDDYDKCMLNAPQRDSAAAVVAESGKFYTLCYGKCLEKGKFYCEQTDTCSGYKFRDYCKEHNTEQEMRDFLSGNEPLPEDAHYAFCGNDDFTSCDISPKKCDRTSGCYACNDADFEQFKAGSDIILKYGVQCWEDCETKQKAYCKGMNVEDCEDAKYDTPPCEVMNYTEARKELNEHKFSETLTTVECEVDDKCEYKTGDTCEEGYDCYKCSKSDADTILPKVNLICRKNCFKNDKEICREVDKKDCGTYANNGLHCREVGHFEAQNVLKNTPSTVYAIDCSSGKCEARNGLCDKNLANCTECDDKDERERIVNLGTTPMFCAKKCLPKKNSGEYCKVLTDDQCKTFSIKCKRFHSDEKEQKITGNDGYNAVKYVKQSGNTYTKIDEAACAKSTFNCRHCSEEDLQSINDGSYSTTTMLAPEERGEPIACKPWCWDNARDLEYCIAVTEEQCERYGSNCLRLSKTERQKKLDNSKPASHFIRYQPVGTYWEVYEDECMTLATTDGCRPCDKDDANGKKYIGQLNRPANTTKAPRPSKKPTSAREPGVSTEAPAVEPTGQPVSEPAAPVPVTSATGVVDPVEPENPVTDPGTVTEALLPTRATDAQPTNRQPTPPAKPPKPKTASPAQPSRPQVPPRPVKPPTPSKPPVKPPAPVSKIEVCEITRGSHTGMCFDFENALERAMRTKAVDTAYEVGKWANLINTFMKSNLVSIFETGNKMKSVNGQSMVEALSGLSGMEKCEAFMNLLPVNDISFTGIAEECEK